MRILEAKQYKSIILNIEALIVFNCSNKDSFQIY